MLCLTKTGTGKVCSTFNFSGKLHELYHVRTSFEKSGWAESLEIHRNPIQPRFHGEKVKNYATKEETSGGSFWSSGGIYFVDRFFRYF